MKSINIYLNFPGTTEEAFNFYKEIFGGEITFIQRFKETPEAGMASESDGEKIMHIMLALPDGSAFMATDALESMGQHLTIGNNVSININTESEKETDSLFEKLSDGGKVEMPLEKAFWGSYFGMCVDKYGIRWMLNYDLNS